MEYTHNLQVLLFDNNDNIIEDNDFLDEIKNILCQNITNVMEWNGKLESFTIKWNKKELNKIDKHFVGDLFSSPAYDSDRIILNHVQKIITNINCKYNIKFYLSRLICEKKINPDCVGII